MRLTTAKMPTQNRLTASAKTEACVAALAPKCLVMMSMHRKHAQDTTMPPSTAKKPF